MAALVVLEALLTLLPLPPARGRPRVWPAGRQPCAPDQSPLEGLNGQASQLQGRDITFQSN